MTTVDNVSQQSDADRGSVLAPHPMIFYVLIAYLGTWIVLPPF